MMATKIHVRMPSFLRGRCPEDRMDHWVWEMFVTKVLQRACTLLVLANHHSHCLDNAKTRDSLLNCDWKVYPLINEEWNEFNGCYLCCDPMRWIIFRSGMTVQGYGPRWKEHERASLLACVQTMWRNMYRKYPHQRVANTDPDRDGTFQDLQQRMALGVRKSDKKAVTELFDFSPLDMERLSKLQYGLNQAGTLVDKQYKNICYLFELLYAIAIRPRDNTTQNPGCEWQLRLYSGNGRSQS
jgi:hypothetical protein